MARFPIAIPSGVFRNGTEYQSKGRYYDANLVRWYGSALGPIGGWRSRGAATVTGKARAAIGWKDNSTVTWLGIGTHSGLYVSDRAGSVFDITPTSFTSCRADAVGAGGYSFGNYSAGTYGTPRPDTSLIQDATQWSLDTWGQYLNGVSPDDNNIVQWELNTGTKAAKVANSPSCKAIIVTPERFLFALGTTDPRTVSWCDQEDNTNWTVSDTTQAGSWPLQTGGRLMCGANVRGGTMLFTDVDAHLATYIGGVSVYRFDKIDDSCGVISRQAACAFNMQVAWMSPSGFWFYNGYAQQIPCDVFDYVFRDINLLQSSKFFATRVSAYSEIEWRYCSASSNEIDRCVVWNYLTGKWTIGRPTRLCGIDKGVFPYPIMVNSGGVIYDHEVGFLYDGDIPYGETGPIELGNGDNITDFLRIIPDDATLGDVTISVYGKMEPDGAETTFGPYTLSKETDVRFCTRQAKVRYSGAVNTAWRVGSPRLDISQGSGR